MNNVKDSIIKMKNMSELILDLGYSALFLRDGRLLEEVEKMYQEISKLERDTMKILFKVKGSDEERVVIIDLIDEIKDVSKSALGIAKLSEVKKFPEIVKNILENTEERVITAEIGRSSSMNGKSLGEIKARTFTKANIIAIKRGDSWIFNIGKETVTRAGDLIIATGSASAREALKRFASKG
jgi:uncharacterized protein with PhoU and TrkA domain